MYKYTCSRDVNVTYVGYSARHLVRAKKHISDCKSNKSETKNHILNCNSCLDENPKFQLDRFSVMCKNAYEAKIHEALQIKTPNPTINKQIYANGASFLLGVYQCFFVCAVMFYRDSLITNDSL